MVITLFTNSRKYQLLLYCLFFLSSSFKVSNDSEFLLNQKKFPRVRVALTEKQNDLVKKLANLKLDLNNLHILLIAYKNEGILEVYVKAKTAITYSKFTEYPVCYASGSLGPKQQKGDGQVPEGFYTIDRFNPSSNFYLSLGIDYPNAADKKRSPFKELGGDIFIHGSCVSIGCLPITDAFIKELYVLAMFAKGNQQHAIPVYIFPFKMDNAQMNSFLKTFQSNTMLANFWTNLKSGYDVFQKDKKALKVAVSSNGKYVYN